MDGELLCFQLSSYKEKYFAEHEKNEPEVVDTDREDVVISNLNDYTGGILKEETSTYDESKTLKVAKLCPSTHAGHQDHPKAVTASVANIVEKWEFSHQKYKHLHPQKTPNGIIKSECFCYENHNISENPDMDESALVDTILECTEKITLHGQTFSKVLLNNGEAKKLMYLLSSMKLVKNKILYYKTLFGDVIQKDYMENDLESMIQAIYGQFIEYYKTTISNEVLHDADSNHWKSSIPYYESQKISTSIQFWGYFMQGLRGDMFNILPEKIARRALHEVLKQSLDILAVRYCQIKPSNKRLPQYRADISVILYVAHDMLLSLVTDMRTLFRPSSSNIYSKSVHQKCLTLLLAQMMVSSPIKNFERYIESQNAPDQGPKRLEPIQKKDSDKLTCWLHLSFPGIYGHVVERLNTPSFIFLLGRMAAVQPHPNWAIIARLCLARDMEFAALIMKNFGAFIPGIRGDNVNVRGLCKPCGHLLCNKRCIPVAGIHWPQEVGSSVLYIVMHGNKDKEALKKVLSPLLSKLNPSAWSVLNKNMVWSQKRPVWLQGLVDLLEPYIFPVVDEMIDDVESGKAWTLAHVPDTISRLLHGMNDITCLVPESFYEVCSMIKPLVPEEVTPLCGSIIVHIFVSSLYGLIDKIIPVLTKWKLSKEKVDFLIAVNEKLCNLEACEDSRRLDENNACVYIEPAINWEEMPEEYATTVSQTVADQLLIEPHGQTALKTIYRFLSYNSEWLQKTVGVTVREVDTLAEKSIQNEVIPVEQPRLLPWEDDVFRTPTPKEMVMHCCFFQYNAMLNMQPSWDDCYKILLPEMNPLLLRQLLTNRCEVNDEENTEEADKTSYQNVLNYINDQLLDKTEHESAK